MQTADVVTRPIDPLGVFQHWGLIFYDYFGRKMVRSKYVEINLPKDETFEEFSKGRPVKNLGRLSNERPDVVIARAGVDASPYDLLTNNCESLCRKANGQAGTSYQALGLLLVCAVGICVYIKLTKKLV